MVPPLEDRLWMEWVEKLVGTPAMNTSEPEFPPSLFYCRLDEQPDHLVPAYALATTGPGTTELALHPQCVFTHGSELPRQFSGNESLVENFALQGPIAWTPHPATGVPQPFWLTAELEDRLRSGARAPYELAPDVQKTLLIAGVLISGGGVEGDWEKNIVRGAEQFRERGYAPFGGMIHPFHVAALRRYYRHRIRTGGMTLGDGQSPRRYVAHNESIARFFHHQLTPLVTAVAGEPVKPSYVYAASYQGGAKLERHTDREQCEFSVTFCLDYSPEPLLATGWPLQLHVKTGMVTVYQAIGDALLYRGRELPHSRKTLRQGQTSTSIFFHYVREDFAGSLD